MNMLINALLLIAALVPSVSSAQGYPAKQPVVLVVPFSAGGSNDTIARFLADRLGKLWKQAVIVENKPGGGSSIGAAYVAKSAPDGYKILLGSGSYTTNAAVKTELGFDPLKDLKAVSMVARGANAVVTGTRVPIATLADLAKVAKAQTIFFGTSGVGSAQHFLGEMLNETMGIQMTPVPYRGGSESLLDLQTGRIDVVVGALAGLLPGIEAGKYKPVAVLSKTRVAALPNTPTTAEAGYPAALSENYWMLYVPSATPDSVVAKINEGIKTVTHTPDARQFLAKLDGEAAEMTPQEATTYVKKEIEYWTRLAKKLNISDK
jgi:tripartite-type tricarboxylate transporter receptor subunit TctC